jgi:hypothetical protein
MGREVPKIAAKTPRTPGKPKLNHEGHKGHEGKARTGIEPPRRQDNKKPIHESRITIHGV